MYGIISSFNLDLPAGGTPQIGDDLIINSPSGRSTRGYVVQDVQAVCSKVNQNRYKLRIMRVPIDQLVSPLPVTRYGKRLLDRRRAYASRPFK